MDENERLNTLQFVNNEEKNQSKKKKGEKNQYVCEWMNGCVWKQ